MESDQTNNIHEDSKITLSSNERQKQSANVDKPTTEERTTKSKEVILSCKTSRSSTKARNPSHLTSKLKTKPVTHSIRKEKDSARHATAASALEKAHLDIKNKDLMDAPDDRKGISLCDRCSESMLSYVSLLGELLDTITVDIINKSIPASEQRKNQCPFCLWEKTKEKIRDPSTPSIKNKKSEGIRYTEKDHHSESCDKHKVLTNQSLPKRIFSNHVSSSHQREHKKETKQRTEHRKHFEKLTEYSKEPSTHVENRSVQTDITFEKDLKDEYQFYSSTGLSENTGSHKENVFKNESSFSSRNQSEHYEKKSDKEFIASPQSDLQIYTRKQASDGETSLPTNSNMSHERSIKKNQEFKKNISHTTWEQQQSTSKEFRSSSESNVSVISQDTGLMNLESAQASASYQNNFFPRRRSFNEQFELLKLQEPSDFKKEAYVTIAMDNMAALSCLVLGNSLKLTNTERILVVLVGDGVTRTLRQLMSSVFDQVQPLKTLNSQGITKLALLKQPELGVSFFKLHVWLLTSFTKCVYLDPDTLVVQNCDELFDRDELSAVPDIGWPDCFNSGVFVYVPSLNTFWSLITFLEEHGTYDGGDQGLLNLYFSFWNQDIRRKLPFIYNLMANVSYTYSPAFKQFGRNVKIVRFFGNQKPTSVAFHSTTGQISPSSKIHPTFAQFVHIWLTIFHKLVFPLFPQDIRNHLASSTYTTAAEVINLFPGLSNSQSQDILPVPPSFRMYRPAVLQMVPQNINLIEQTNTVNEEQVAECKDSIDRLKQEASFEEIQQTQENISEKTLEGNDKSDEESENFENINVKLMADNEEELDVLEKENNDADPSYDSMLAFEQGKIDYMGRYKSDNILERLDSLIKNS